MAKINKLELKEIINEEINSLLKEQRRQAILIEYNNLSNKEKHKSKIIGFNFIKSLYESNFITAKDIHEILLSEAKLSKLQKEGLYDAAKGMAKNWALNKMGKAGLLIRKLASLEGGDILDALQVVLDIVGVIPGLGVGEIADGINVAISVLRGNMMEAALNLIGLIPFADAIAKPVKYLLKAGEAIPFKYLSKIVPALTTTVPKLIEKFFKFMEKIPVPGGLKNKLSKTIKGSLEKVTNIFTEMLGKAGGGVDDMAQNIGKYATGKIKTGLQRQVDKQRAARNNPNPQPA